MRWRHRVVLGGALALIATAGMAAKKGKLEELPPAPLVEAPGAAPVKQDQVNYDEVGYAGTFDGAGVAIAHKTLPAGSFAEVTNLSSGRTILTQVIASGPVGPQRIVALSSAAAAQLGMDSMTPGVRVRRTNPPEHERTALRNGGQAAERLETPPALLNALRKKLSVAPAIMAAAPAPKAVELPAKPAPAAKAPPPKPVEAASSEPVRIASAPPMRAGADYEAPAAIADAEAAASMPSPPPPGADDRFVEEEAKPHWKEGRTPGAAPSPKRPVPAATPAPARAATGTWYVQIGAFASAANARAAAARAGGTISQTGNLYRVRTGPYSSEAAARAALGPLAAKGYRGARVTR